MRVFAGLLGLTLLAVLPARSSGADAPETVAPAPRAAVPAPRRGELYLTARAGYGSQSLNAVNDEIAATEVVLNDNGFPVLLRRFGGAPSGSVELAMPVGNQAWAGVAAGFQRSSTDNFFANDFAAVTQRMRISVFDLGGTLAWMLPGRLGLSVGAGGGVGFAHVQSEGAARSFFDAEQSLVFDQVMDGAAFSGDVFLARRFPFAEGRFATVRIGWRLRKFDELAGQIRVRDGADGNQVRTSGSSFVGMDGQPLEVDASGVYFDVGIGLRIARATPR